MHFLYKRSHLRCHLIEGGVRLLKLRLAVPQCPLLAEAVEKVVELSFPFLLELMFVV